MRYSESKWFYNAVTFTRLWEVYQELNTLGGGALTRPASVVKTMERDCILGQGSARFARDRLMEQSDEFRMWMCDICGLPAHVEKEGEIRECRLCGTTKVSKIKLPYGSKLIGQELMVANIVPRLLTNPHSSDTAGNKNDQ